MRVPSRWFVLGASLLAGSLWLRHLGADPDPSAYAFVLAQLLLGAVYLTAVWSILRRPSAVPLWYLLAIALLCRLIVLPSPPLFDDDLHRYLWEGKVVAHGGNPYLYPPIAPELATLRDENWAHVGYPEIRTIYPPLAQYLFAVPHLLGHSNALGAKLLFLLFDLGNVLLIASLLTRLNRPRSWALIYAWSPLALKEFTNSGHLEPAMLFFLLLSLHLAFRTRRMWAGLCYGAALAIKPVPLVLAPLFWRLNGARSLAVAAALAALLALPFLSAGRLLLSGSSAYAHYWTFNPGPYALLAALLPWGSTARIAAAALVMGYAIWRARGVGRGRPEEVLRAARDTLAACLLLSPVVDPWYVCWLLPFLALTPNAPLLTLTVTCNLSYLYYASGSFPAWIPVVEYGVVAVVWAIGRWRTSPARAASEYHPCDTYPTSTRAG